MWFRLHEAMEAAGSAVGDLKAVTSRAQRAMKVQIGRGVSDWWDGGGLNQGIGQKDGKRKAENSFFHHFSEKH